MRILIIIPSLVKGGAERVACILSEHWAESHEVTIGLFDVKDISYEYGGKVIDLLAASGRGISKLYNPFLRVKNIKRLIDIEDPELIFSFMESANFPTIMASLLSGYSNRLAVSVRNNPESFPKIHQYLIPYFYAFPKRVVPISKGVEEWLKKHQRRDMRLKHIPNPIDIKKIDDFLLTQEHMLKKYTPYILAVGRLNKQKGFDLLIKAFYTAKLSDINLIILGEGSERKALEELISLYGLQSRVKLLGNLYEPFSAYRYAICFVLSSRYEGWGNVIMEAMCCGCPVISFNCDYGPSEIIEDGISGILVENNDINALTGAMIRLVEDGALRENLIKQGRRRVEEFSVNQVSLMWLNNSD